MKITSSAFQNGMPIPKKYTCDGQNINPPFVITDVPANTQSLVLILHDIDVPTYIQPTGVWDHWVIFNIPPTIQVIEEGKEPQGVHGVGTGKNQKYYGPCPPDREHRYFFTLFALDSLLPLPAKSSRQDIEAHMANHILAKAEIMGVYGRE